MTTSIPQPDVAARPFNARAEIWMPYPPTRLYRAWTQEFDLWFAAAGTVVMDPQPGQPFFFQTEHAGQRHSHYGRFLRLIPAQLVEITWVTGKGGTEGAETLLTVEFTPESNGARIHLSHRGFPNAEAASRHEHAWPLVLAQQEQRLQ
jgi:uncharacterized protein YndB with AHSA1/START domain